MRVHDRVFTTKAGVVMPGTVYAVDDQHIGVVRDDEPDVVYWTHVDNVQPIKEKPMRTVQDMKSEISLLQDRIGCLKGLAILRKLQSLVEEGHMEFLSYTDPQASASVSWRDRFTNQVYTLLVAPK